jgi:DNA-binding NarL/FixJ family response regulator
MVLLAQNFSPESGLRVDAGRMPLGTIVGVALAIDDLTLARQLRRALLTETGLNETADAIADVVITDRDGVIGRNVLRLGASALETTDADLIVAAARLRAAGYRIEREVEERSALGPATDRRALSQRERQVAGLLVDGASNKVIARALDISVHTAKFHVTAILDKLGARNRADAVSILLRERLLAA